MSGALDTVHYSKARLRSGRLLGVSPVSRVVRNHCNNLLAVWWVPDMSGPLSRKTTGKHAVLVVGELGSRYERADKTGPCDSLTIVRVSI